MCKFHKDVARDIATDPVTGTFDPGRFSVALLAMAKYRIEQYMPAMHGCDGFMPASMTTDAARQAFAASGLHSSFEEGRAYRDAHIAALRAAMDRTAAAFDLSMQALNNPDTLTAKGYRHCEKMGPDISKAGPFMDEAVVQLFKGYDDDAKTWARHDLHLVSTAHKPEFEPLRAATEYFLAQPGVEPALHRMFEHSLFRIFEEARLGSGSPGVETDGCVMCGHGSRADEAPSAPQEDAAAPAPEKEPGTLRKIFSSCATCTGSGVSASLVSHLFTCVLPTLLLTGATGAAMASTMMAWMVPVSPIVAAGLTAAKDRVMNKRVSLFNMAASAVIAIPITLGVQHLLMPGMDMNHMQPVHRMPGTTMPGMKMDGMKMDMNGMDGMNMPICGGTVPQAAHP
jgi:hypothetical protein